LPDLWRALDVAPVRLPASAVGGYVELPFTCPADAVLLDVALEFAQEPEAVVDFGVLDPVGVRGWSGSARRSARIAQALATPGYRPGPLPSGRWAVLLGAYRLPADGLVVRANVRCLMRGPRWLKGDLHLHTLHSDGQDAPWQVADAAAELALDFVALTDHNTATAWADFPVREDVFAVPGYEWTTSAGHCNLLGEGCALPDFRVRDPGDAAALLGAARTADAFACVTHPFDDACAGCAWGWGLDLPFDAVEVWNGPWRPCNHQALTWWQGQLERGRRLPALGGSDHHAPHPFVRRGMPTTWVLAEEPTPQGVLAALRAGHAALSVGPEGPLLDLRCGPHVQGDLVPFGAAGPLSLQADARPGDRLRLYTEAGLTREDVLVDGRVDLTFDRGGHRFWRAELWRWFEEVRWELPAAISNPLYFAKDA